MRYNAEQQEAFEKDFQERHGQKIQETFIGRFAEGFIEEMTDLDVPFMICVIDPETGEPKAFHNLISMTNKRQSNHHNTLMNFFTIISGHFSGQVENIMKYFKE